MQVSPPDGAVASLGLSFALGHDPLASKPLLRCHPERWSPRRPESKDQQLPFVLSELAMTRPKRASSTANLPGLGVYSCVPLERVHPMRRRLVALLFFTLTLGGLSQKTPNLNISQVSEGTLSGNIYTNETVGIVYEVPSGWSAYTDPKHATMLDQRKPNGAANQCSKILLSLQAPHPVEGRFSSSAAIIAMDPSCFSKMTFPQSLQDKNALGKIADKIIKPLSNSPYLSPYGVEIRGWMLQGHVVVQLVGGLTINAIEGHPPPTKEPLKVNTSFSFTESNGYWVAWAYLADDPSSEQLDAAKMTFNGIRPQ